MTGATLTIQRLQALERLYTQGYQDDVVDLTLHKLLEHQIQKDEAQLAELHENLTSYEQLYGMTSADFVLKYQAGQMGDSAEVFEWNVFYKMLLRLEEAVDTLKTELGT